MSGETFVFRGEWDDRGRWEPLPPGPVQAFLTAVAERFPPSVNVAELLESGGDWQAEFGAPTFTLIVFGTAAEGGVGSLTLDFAWTGDEDDSTEADLRAVFELVAELGAELGATVRLHEEDLMVRDRADAARAAALSPKPEDGRRAPGRPGPAAGPPPPAGGAPPTRPG